MSSQQPLIVLLKDGTDDHSGRQQIISNIQACNELVNIVRTTLGPRGNDKLIKGTVTNDGATIVKLLNIDHPAARTLVDIAKSQDSEVGDGTTSVVVLTGAFLQEAKGMLESGLTPQVIRRGYQEGLALALRRMEEMKQIPAPENERETLINIAATTLNSKLLASNGRLFGEMAADAILKLEEDDLELIGVKKIKGGSVTDSFMVDGVAFAKCFSYAGFEQQTKEFKDPLVLCLNIELELKAEKDNAEVRISDPDQYQSIVDAEWKIIYDKLEKCVSSKANIILSRMAIGDLATQYFADRGLFCAGRVPEGDMKRVCKATGAQMQSVLSNVPSSALGTCGTFDERQIGAERYNIFLDCPKSSTATIILRGGADQFVEEAERSVHDALCAVRRAHKFKAVVAGGGAIEMDLSKFIRTYSRSVQGKQQFVLNNYAKALEIIPMQLASNAGYDATDILNKLRYTHHQNQKDGHFYGVDINTGDIINTFSDAIVWEPMVVKRNALISATEAACLILSIDETITNPKSEQAAGDSVPIGGRAGGRGRGGRGRGRGRG